MRRIKRRKEEPAITVGLLYSRALSACSYWRRCILRFLRDYKKLYPRCTDETKIKILDLKKVKWVKDIHVYRAMQEFHKNEHYRIEDSRRWQRQFESDSYQTAMVKILRKIYRSKHVKKPTA